MKPYVPGPRYAKLYTSSFDTFTRNFDRHNNGRVAVQLQKHLEPRAPTKAIDEIRIDTAAKSTKASTEANGSTPDLQLCLSPNVGADTDRPKKRKNIALSEQEVDSDKLPLSLSLSLRFGHSGDEGGGADAGRLDAATGSSSKKAALGLSTLDLTMSIKALE